MASVKKSFLGIPFNEPQFITIIIPHNREKYYSIQFDLFSPA